MTQRRPTQRAHCSATGTATRAVDAATVARPHTSDALACRPKTRVGTRCPYAAGEAGRAAAKSASGIEDPCWEGDPHHFFPPGCDDAQNIDPERWWATRHPVHSGGRKVKRSKTHQTHCTVGVRLSGRRAHTSAGLRSRPACCRESEREERSCGSGRSRAAAALGIRVWRRRGSEAKHAAGSRDLSGAGDPLVV